MFTVQNSQGDGVALINYMHRMNTDDECDDEDLEPSAEDLEIFAELEREQEERQARIDRGEPAVDPMVRSLTPRSLLSTNYDLSCSLMIMIFH